MRLSRPYVYLSLAGVLALTASGCAQLGYFAQAAHGQWSLLSEARPIDDWLADPGVDTQLKNKLGKAREIRSFAARELALPDNGSYKNYADLKRPYVLWNVVATPALSLTPKQWCFPVAGCVTYRGYYSKAEAQAYANELRAEGMDVQMAGVQAYSTLGWFNDPLISTFIKHPDGELARLIFHELAHQVAYAPGDSEFNESFATAVEEVGVERWMALHGDLKTRKLYAEFEGRKQDFLALLLASRKALEANYADNVDDATKLARKAAIFQSLKDQYQVMKARWGGFTGYDRWFAEPLSNAHLASIATYHDLVPAFRALLKREKNFAQFYVAVKDLAASEQGLRQAELAALASRASAAAATPSVPTLSTASTSNPH